MLIWKNHKTSKNKLGESTYSKLIEIIKVHGLGGEEQQDNVELKLE